MKHFKNIPMADLEIVLVSFAVSITHVYIKLYYLSMQKIKILFSQVVFRFNIVRNIYILTARKEESKFNTYGLGQVFSVSNNWPGQLLHPLKFM